MSSSYSLLSPTIQDYIYRKGWKNLREVQEQSIQAILQTDNNVLLASKTASGKTEAAFFPILTELEKRPSESISVIYISPLIALINDQFERLQDILEEEDLPVVRWHGQALQSAKKKVMQNPQGIIQITPESLEALLMREGKRCYRLFKDLRYIVIDEVHHFMAAERGLQVLCLIGIIEQIIGHSVRHIGLSATLADYKEAASWLEGGNGRECSICTSHEKGGTLNLLVKECPYVEKTMDGVVEISQPWLEAVYALVRHHRTLLFANSRNEVEFSVAGIREKAEEKKDKLLVYAHHGSLSRLERGDAEDALKNAPGDVCVGATITLELGIDVGALDLIVQAGAPLSVSSFVQRLGRTGRKGQDKNMAFILKRRDSLWKGEPTYLPFDLLSSLAIIELYLKEQWIEPVYPMEKCYFLLLHQAMALIKSFGAMRVSSLARHLLTLKPFAHITQDALKTLLQRMIEEDLLEIMEDGTINLGERGEVMASHYDFYSVFLVIPEITIKYQDKVLGTVGRDLQLGDRLVLTGHKWKVTFLDLDKLVAQVEPDGKGGYAKWEGTGTISVDDRILQKIHEILESTEIPTYLDPCATEYLEKIRARYRFLGLDRGPVVCIEKDMVRIYPWLGTKSMNCLIACLQTRGIEAVKESHFCLVVEKKSKRLVREIKTALEEITYAPVDLMSLPVEDRLMMNNFKFDTLLPPSLQKEEYVYWAFNPKGMKKGLMMLEEKGFDLQRQK